MTTVVALTKWNTEIAPNIAIEQTDLGTISVYWGALIPAIPNLLDLEQSRTGMNYETALQNLLQSQQRWVQQLHGDRHSTLSLRIISAGKSDQNLIFGFVGKTEGKTESETIAHARNFFNQIRDTFPNDYPFQPCQQPEELALLRFPFFPSGEIGEFRRAVTPLQSISLPNSSTTGCQINPWAAQSDVFQDLLRSLLCHPTPAAIAINLKSTQLTPQESSTIATSADAYAKLASRSRGETEQNRVLSSTINYQEKFLEAEQAAQTWQHLQSSWRSPFELSISLIAESAHPQSVISALQSSVSGAPVREDFSRGTGQVVIAQTEAQKMAVRQNWADLTLHRWANLSELDRLPWLFSPEEVHSVFRLPIADRQGVWGLPSAVGANDARRPAQEKDEIADIRIGGLTLSKKQLTQHLLICGVPGSGKTNTSLYLLETLWREHRIPWMVLEPAKTEYRGLQAVDSLKDDLFIFSVGDERVAPFRFNPFELPATINLDSHLGALVDLFSVSMSMWGPLPNVVEQLIQEAYKRKGFTLLGNNSGLIPPRFSDLASLIPEIVPKLGYKKETTDEITAALSVRLNKFCRGALGQMLNTIHSVPFDLLMQRPVILEMSQMTNTDDRAFVMGLILNRCYQYWIARRHEATGELKHLLLVEEAHNLLGNVSESTNQEQANPKGKAVRNFANMLAEVRGFGQGIAIAEQNPDGLVPDIMVNTNIKLAHRIVEAKNREALGRSMLLTPQQEIGLAALKTGQMLYYVGGDAEPSLTHAPNFKDADNGFNLQLTDAQIQARFKQRTQAQFQELYQPMMGCSSGASVEQASDLVQILLEHPRYKPLKRDLMLQLLATPFGFPALEAVQPIFGRILLERGLSNLDSIQIQAILKSAIALLALEAVKEKGKVHGWLGHQIKIAHQLLVQSIYDSSDLSAWVDLCQIPHTLLQLGIPHPEYSKHEPPGVFRYENQVWLESDRTTFTQDLENETLHPSEALQRWAETMPLYAYLNSTHQRSLTVCLAIQLTESAPEDLAYFLNLS